jgi:hypothetical protein
MSLGKSEAKIGKFPRASDNEGLRSSFKDNLTKLIAINTREHVHDDI